MEELFKSLSESVSEECFNDIMGIVEEIIAETKKANKMAHQEAIFRKLNPQGTPVSGFRDQLSTKGKKVTKRLTNVYKDDDYISGTAHSLRDFRDFKDTDNKKSAPYYDYEHGGDLRSDNAIDVRDALGRGKEFSNKDPKPSKSHQAAQAYNQYRDTLKKLKSADK